MTETQTHIRIELHKNNVENKIFYLSHSIDLINIFFKLITAIMYAMVTDMNKLKECLQFYKGWEEK